MLCISFGFLMAIAWVRSNAPDIALAEAAIGSAMTGGLLLAALGEFKPAERAEVSGRFVIAGLACTLFACLLGNVVFNLPTTSGGLRDVVLDDLEQTGVNNPVTAVLLGFRGYDTLLEIAVLFMAVLAVLYVQNARPSFAREPSTNPVLMPAVRTILPVMILTGAYLLWVGANAPGGAFQAGSVPAGVMILASLTDARWLRRISEMGCRLALVFGLAGFVVVAAGTPLADGSLLGYRDAASKWLMLAIETAAMISIACTLTVLLVGQIDHRIEEEDDQ